MLALDEVGHYGGREGTGMQALQSLAPERVYHNGDEFFDDLIGALNSATVSVDFEAYTFENDRLGRRVARALTAAASRGVKVRILVDGAGSPNWHADFMPQLLSAGIECRIYHPFPWQIRSFKKFFERIAQLNRRNHKKSYIVDGKFAWVGSMNISECHMPRHAGAEAWRDSGVRIYDGRVQALTAAFESSWREGRFLRRGSMRRLHPLVRLNNTRLRRETIYKDLLKRIARAQERVWVTNAYFVPRRGLVRSLCRAASSGADVRLLLPKDCDIFFIPWVSSVFYDVLLRSGVKIYEYKKSMCHAKTLVIDKWSTIGSSNMNHRSLFHDLEVDVVLSTVEARQSIEGQFIEDLTNSCQVKLEEWKQRPWLERFFCRTLLLIKHFI